MNLLSHFHGRLFSSKHATRTRRSTIWFGLFLCFGYLVAVQGCSEKKSTTASGDDDTDDPVIIIDEDDPPVTGFIHNLGVTFAPFNPASKRAGDFIFDSYYGKVFYEFAAVVGAGGGATKELPTFEYRIRKDASVFAVADGKVLFKTFQAETQDYEMLVQSIYDEDWAVCYDHVKNPRFAVNDRIATGDTLGSPGTWDATLGRFEISVNNIRNSTSYCPFCYFDEATSALYQAKVAQHIAEIEAFLGNPSLYDEAHHIYPGCRKESMKN